MGNTMCTNSEGEACSYTEHAYLPQNLGSAKYLILGTIYPYKNTGTSEFFCDFFYGNKYSLWDILKKVFSNLGIYSLEEVAEKSPKEAAAKIKAVLAQGECAISDTVKKACRPEDKPWQDKFLADTSYNESLIDQIKGSSISKILFTSIDARKLFFHVYNRVMHQKGIKPVDLPHNCENKFNTGSCFNLLDSSYFGRTIETVILPSPSKNSRTCLLFKEQKKQSNYSKWREDFYRKHFHFLDK